MDLPVNSVLLGPCLEHLKTLPDASVDAIVTDPPYGLGTREPTVEDIQAYLSGGRLDHGGDFMGRDWEIPPVEVWRECFRVLKPGGHLLSFGGTRTFDLISLGIRAAGFENRDTIASQFGASVLQWVYGSGFPKSLNISKAIDKMLGAEREVVGTVKRWGANASGGRGNQKGNAYQPSEPGAVKYDDVTAPGSEEAAKWEGWGTALKPSWEPILVFRKPVEGTVAQNVLEHGTGGLNIDATRVSHQEGSLTGGGGKLWSHTRDGTEEHAAPRVNNTGGRWPSNLVIVHNPECRVVGSKRVKAPVINRFDDGMKPFGDGAGHEYTSEQQGDEDGMEEVPVYECVDGCPVKLLDGQSGVSSSHNLPATNHTALGLMNDDSWEPSDTARIGYSDSGGASRFFGQFQPKAPFFYSAKASKREKNQGISSKVIPGFFVLRDDLTDEELDQLQAAWTEDLPSYDNPVPEDCIPSELMSDADGTRPLFVAARQDINNHPTVKPIDLMRWLVKLVCPKGGVVLDPYCGSGSTCIAAIEEHCQYIGIERDPEFHALSLRRIAHVESEVLEVRAQQEALNLMDELPQE